MRTPIIPDSGSSRIASHHSHPEGDQFAIGEDEIIPPPASRGLITDAEAAAIARMAEAWRKANGLTHKAFIARFNPYIHNSKGWWLVRTMPPSQWESGWDRLRATLPGLRAAIEEADRASRNPLIATPMTRACAKAIELLRKQRTAQRFVFILGATGSGKTSTLDYLESQWEESPATQRKVIRLRGREAWKSPREFLADWGHALDIGTMHKSVAACQTQIREALKQLGDAVIMIDEGHRMNAGEINMLIDWSNDLASADDNAVHFIVAAVDTLWRKLSDAAREEADQLRVNRCLGSIDLGTPGIEEVASLLESACRVSTQLPASDYTAFLDCVADKARTAGSRAYVRDVRALLAMQPALTLKGAVKIATDVAAKNHLKK